MLQSFPLADMLEWLYYVQYPPLVLQSFLLFPLYYFCCCCNLIPPNGSLKPRLISYSTLSLSDTGNAFICFTDTLKSISEGCQRRRRDGWRQQAYIDGDRDTEGVWSRGGCTLTALSNGCHYCVTLSSVPILILSRPKLHGAGFIIKTYQKTVWRIHPT